MMSVTFAFFRSVLSSLRERSWYFGRAGCVCLALLLVLPASLTLAADSEDERFLVGLRQRRLFALAEAYCQDRLQDPKLDPARRATLVIEGMLTLSQQAIYAPAAEREKYWQAARALGDKVPADHPRKSVVDLQAALVTLAQGELARQEAEAANAAPEGFAAAQKFLRAATLELETLEKRIAQQIAARRDPAEPGELSAAEFFALQHNTRYQLARARRNQGLCYPPRSNDRVAALHQAVEQLDKLRTLLADDDPLAWRVQVDQGLCARLLENDVTATRIFTDLLASSATPPAIAAQARAELARLKITAGQPYEAFQILDAGRTSAAATSAELEYALLETRVAQWKEALSSQDQANADRFRDDAVEQLALLEKQFGAYWSRRGEHLLLGSAGSDDRSLDILVRTADARFVKGQFDDETLKVYDQAAQTALKAKQVAKYLELSYRAATVQERRKQTADASARMQRLGAEVADLVDPEDPLFAQSSAVHLHGLQLAKALGKPVELQAKYREHLAIWPREASASEVRWELGALCEQAGQWPEALEAYQQIALDHPRALAGISGAARVWPKQLEALQAKPPARAAAVQKAVSYFRSAIASPDAKLPETFNDVQRLAALCGARLSLQYTSDGGTTAETLLAAAIAGSPDASPAWRNTAQALLVVALAAQPTKHAEAEQLLTKIGQQDPPQLLEMLQGLTQLAASASPEVRDDLARLQLAAIAQLRPQASKLSAPQRTALQVVEAEALAAAGQRDSALEAYRALIKAQPQNGAVQEGYATLLSAQDDKPSLQQALGQWRLIAQASRPQGDRWWRAKYQVALLSYKLGDKDQAAQLIRYLDVTPPGLKGTPLEKEFRALLLKAQ